MILSTRFHSPVLLCQVIRGLNVRVGKKYIDATVGGGGYSFAIIKRGGIVLGIDLDKDALEFVKKKLKSQKSKVKIGREIFLEQGNFAEIKKIAEKYGFNKVAGIIFDLGFSSFQLERAGRGFSYKGSEPLDMRLSTRQLPTAADIVNKYSEGELYEIFTKFAEEVHSRAIVSAILSARAVSYIGTTDKLVSIIDKIAKQLYVGKTSYQISKLRNSLFARIFQALRIAVNNELNSLKEGLTAAIDLLEEEGRLTVLSYHSLEDRLVKLKFRANMKKNKLILINKKPIVAAREEVFSNPKSHSARLRIAEKL